jgi:hypothetical protein
MIASVMSLPFRVMLFADVVQGHPIPGTSSMHSACSAPLHKAVAFRPGSPMASQSVTMPLPTAPSAQQGDVAAQGAAQQGPQRLMSAPDGSAPAQPDSPAASPLQRNAISGPLAASHAHGSTTTSVQHIDSVETQTSALPQQPSPGPGDVIAAQASEPAAVPGTSSDGELLAAVVSSAAGQNAMGDMPMEPPTSGRIADSQSQIECAYACPCKCLPCSA